MKITSAEFIKGIVGPDESLEEDFPQVAFIGRSNVGKSSIIKSLVWQKNLARTSARPGRTQEINLFLINNSRYLLDLPGYGYAKTSKQTRLQLREIMIKKKLF
jgi:GTP-binding protein